MRYFALSKEVRGLREESARLAYLVESVMYEEEAILQQFKQAEQQHQQLLGLLPADLQVEVVEQRLTTLAVKYQAKVLAIKSAIHSRPRYREAGINMTLEATADQVKQLLRELRATPRIMTIAPPESLGKTNVQLTITIYAQNPTVPEEFEPPRCARMPGGILLPPLRERLAALHAEYQRHCNFVANYSDLYRKQRRLHALQQENTRLDGLIAEVRREMEQ
ncbi:MAG: hypothetical protein OQL08_00150 [Gammaproteobacteria bacterium]|nr:hypothetical protein [Gammaproteobacteria bacterium]